MEKAQKEKRPCLKIRPSKPSCMRHNCECADAGGVRNNSLQHVSGMHKHSMQICQAGRRASEAWCFHEAAHEEDKPGHKQNTVREECSMLGAPAHDRQSCSMTYCCLFRAGVVDKATHHPLFLDTLKVSDDLKVICMLRVIAQPT